MRLWVVAAILFAISCAECSVVDRSHSRRPTQHFEGNSFIKMVSLTDRAIIEITFFRDMKADTLNRRTIRVVSEKQSRDVTDTLALEYDPLNRRLTLRPLHPQFDFGTGNLVTVHVSSEVRDLNGARMGKDFEQTFNT